MTREPDGARYAHVLVEVEPFHLDRPFDYRIPPDATVGVGSRVEVVFGGRRTRGLVVGLSGDTDVPAGRVRPLRRVLGPHAWMTEEDIALARWAGRRFCAPVADVIRHALPRRVVAEERRAAEAGWFPPGRGTSRPTERGGLPGRPSSWDTYGSAGTGLHEAVAEGRAGSFYWRPLPDERVGERLVELARVCLAAGRDVLVVVPDPASSVGGAVVDALGRLVVDARGEVPPRERYRGWLRARCGRARVVVGERAVCWWPLERLGLAVAVDEANPALKERRSPRHHAREVVLERARRRGAVGLVTGLVPSAPAWRLLEAGRLRPVRAARADERSRAPLVEVTTARGRPRTRLLPEATAALRRATAAGGYGVVLAARRGEGRALVCHDCGDRVTCPRCDATVDAAPEERAACARCGWCSGRRPSCRACGATTFVPLRAGARRLASELRRTLDAEVVAMEGYDAPAPPPPAVLVMTRGSVLDAPPGPVGAVVLADLDGLVRRPRLDAAEDTLRLALQVAAWTVHPLGGGVGRGEGGTAAVVVQTRRPDDRVVQALVRWDPDGFWRHEARTRAELRFPPAAAAVRVRVPTQEAEEVAERLGACLPAGDTVVGPAEEDGQAAFLLKCDRRRPALAALAELRRELSATGTDLWVDVDPVPG